MPAGEGALDGIADDALVLLIGPAGAGKSTWAAANVPPEAVISSDELRALVAGDAADQGATADAFRLLHGIVRARLVVLQHFAHRGHRNRQRLDF